MIYLKWFSKIKKWIKSEDVYEIEEIILQDDEQLNIQELQKQGVKVTTLNESRFYNKSGRKSEQKSREEQPIRQETYSNSNELDAKIHYQYPKGAFRFPVIPDTAISERRKTEKPSTSQRVARPIVNIEKIRPITPTANYSVNEATVSKQMQRRPFRASEIPSPVYGFQQRPKEKRNDAFESELDNSRLGKSSVNLNSNVKKETKIPAFTEPTPTEDIPAIFRKQAEEQKDGNSSIQEAPIQNEEVKLMSEIDGPLEQIDIHKIEQPKEIHVDSNQEQEDYTTTLQHEEFTSEIVKEAGEMQATNNELATDDADEIIKEEADIQTNAPFESYEESAAAVQATVHDEFAVVEEQASPQTEPTTPVVETEKEEKKRKHIPFNVVMLRQDRERWQRQVTKMSEKKTVEVENHEHVTTAPESNEVCEKKEEEKLPYYQFPSISSLTPSVKSEHDDDWLDQQGHILNETLFNFNVRASVVNITQGPAVTQFEIQPEPGVKVNKITNLADDIKLCLAAQDIRIEAPIPGKHTIGIEIPNRKSRPVFLREILENEAFIESESPLTVALGLDITGKPIVTDLRKMPHGLIAGATGSGKSVCINSMLISLLYKATPQEVKLLLIDPKMVELAPYNHIPHLVSPVITDVKAATAALKWAVEEMERRYELFAHTGVRDIGRFNKKAEEAGQFADRLPYIVIIIDELADLMMMSPAEVEESICRIAQKARACGIHLVLATQRPSVDVITGLIKANIPTRVAFSVSSQVDSRTILDSNGADKLLGRGDMLFLENGSSKTVRLQGTFVSDEEIEEVVDFVRKEQEPQYLFQQEDLLAKAQVLDERDELFLEACEFVVFQNAASTSSLQRRFHIGYNRAARLMDILESNGIISEARGSKPRDVLMTEDEYQEWVQMQMD